MVTRLLRRCSGSRGLALFGVALLAVSFMANPTSAQTCLAESSNTADNKLNCTSQDVKIAAITGVKNLDGTALTTCNAGVRYSFIMVAQLSVTSSSSRSNVGMYFAEDNQSGSGTCQGNCHPGGATSGNCWRDVIPPTSFTANAFCTGPAAPFPCCTGSGVGTCNGAIGTTSPTELDPQPDNCGDGNSNSSQTINILAENILCEPDATNHLRLPACLSWQVPGQTIACNTTAPTYPWVPAAIPGTSAKCNCNVLSVPVIVQHASIGVSKSATVETPTGHDGSIVDYSVTVTNTSNLGGVTINQLCDDQYGDIKTAATSPAQQLCAAPSLCSSLCTGSNTPFTGCTGAGTGNFPAGSSCATNVSCALPASLPNPTPGANSSVTCTFNGQIPENSTITDKVTANGVDASIPPNGVSGTATASATAGDAPSSANLIKTVGNAQSGCATLRFTAEIDNTSGSTTDEGEKLWALSDSQFGSLTSLHGDSATNNSIVGTTCGVDSGSKGLGTLGGVGGVNGGGAFSMSSAASIPVGGKYTCQFDGVMCGTLATVTKPNNGGTCQGLQETDTLLPTLTSDEASDSTHDVVPTVTGGSLTVTECFDTFSQ